jgi:hypothetical protein
VKTTLTAIASTILAVALGIGFHYSFRVANGIDETSNADDEVQTRMVEAREIFMQKNEDVQHVAQYLYDKPGTRYVCPSGGFVESDATFGIAELDDGIFTHAFKNAFGGYNNGGRIYNIVVTNLGVYFYTSYTQAGVVGFVYETVINNTEDYDTLEIVENWKLFYKMND